MAGAGAESPKIGGKTLAIDASDGHKAEFVARLFSGPGFDQVLPMINLVIVVLGWFSLSIEVFLRKDFGERYLSPIRFFLAWFAFSTLAFGGQVVNLMGMAYGPREGGEVWKGLLSGLLFHVLYWGFLIMSAWQFRRISKRNKRGERWHSWSFGVSRFSGLIGRKVGSFTIDDWALYRFIEPTAIFALAVLVGLVSVPAGSWLWLASVTLLLKNNYMYAQAHGRLLDLVDAQIEGQYLQAALRGEDKQKTAGYSVVRAPSALDKDGDGMPDTLQTAPPSQQAPQAQGLDFGDVVRETMPTATETGQRPAA